MPAWMGPRSERQRWSTLQPLFSISLFPDPLPSPIPDLGCPWLIVATMVELPPSTSAWSARQERLHIDVARDPPVHNHFRDDLPRHRGVEDAPAAETCGDDGTVDALDGADDREPRRGDRQEAGLRLGELGAGEPAGDDAGLAVDPRALGVADPDARRGLGHRHGLGLPADVHLWAREAKQQGARMGEGEAGRKGGTGSVDGHTSRAKAERGARGGRERGLFGGGVDSHAFSPASAQHGGGTSGMPSDGFRKGTR
mmetsp:Transcript_3079/g.7257  ORF Transcript_3079/g.7257 Transcript_3079/m.7257 type:complete len:255 (+) Transcript_3079:236-1000(+)